MEKQVKNFLNCLKRLEIKSASTECITSADIIEIAKLFHVFYRNANVYEFEKDWENFCNSYALILFNWVHSNADVSTEELHELLKYQNGLSAVFKASADSEQRCLMSVYLRENKYTKNLTKLLLVLSINNLNDGFYALYEKASNKHALYLAIGWLSERTITSNTAKMYHQLIVNGFHRFADEVVDFDYIPALCRAYMYTTYSNSDGKDCIKQTINSIIRNTFEEKYNITNLELNNSKKRKIKAKLKLVIVHERFTSTHVMLRIYKFLYQELQKYFEVYHVTWGDQEIDDLKKVFPNIVLCEESLNDVLQSLRKLNADIIFYPSIGMSSIGIVLSTFRLAPVQLQIFGHPSSANSKNIDGSLYGSLNHSHTGTEKLDKYEGYKNGIYFPFVLKKLPKKVKHNPDSVFDDCVRVALNAKIMKLNPDFLQFLESLEITEKSQYKFFPAEKGTEYLACKNLLLKKFPYSEVYPVTEYKEFMLNLARTDIAICPFPFGNTNGIQDCFYLGLPTVVLRGHDICSATETQLLERAEMHEFLFDNETDMKLFIQNFVNKRDFREKYTNVFQEKSARLIKNNNLISASRYEAKEFIKWIRSWSRQLISDE